MNKEMLDLFDFITFDSGDCNDEVWKVIIDVLRERIPNFKVEYGDGNWMTFCVPKQFIVDEYKPKLIKYFDDLAKSAYDDYIAEMFTLELRNHDGYEYDIYNINHDILMYEDYPDDCCSKEEFEEKHPNCDLDETFLVRERDGWGDYYYYTVDDLRDIVSPETLADDAIEQGLIDCYI